MIAAITFGTRAPPRPIHSIGFMLPQEEKDLLIRVVSQVAQKQLETGGQMHFGALLGPKRDVQLLMPESIKKDASWEELRTYWKRQLGAVAAKIDWRAISYCTFGTSLNEAGHKSGNVLVIHVEHSALPAETVFYPYTGSRGNPITLGEPTREVTDRWMASDFLPAHSEDGT